MKKLLFLVIVAKVVSKDSKFKDLDNKIWLKFDFLLLNLIF